MKFNFRYFYFNVFALLFVVLLSGCTVKYVAQYDAAVKAEIVHIAKKVDMFWGELLDTDAGERKYSTFKGKYNEIESDLRALVMQNEIRELNEATTTQAKTALDLWIQDRTFHKDKDTFNDFQAKKHREQYYRVFKAMAIGEDIKEK